MVARKNARFWDITEDQSLFLYVVLNSGHKRYIEKIMELIGSDISLLTKTLVKETWKKVFAMELNDLGREGNNVPQNKKKGNSVNKIEAQKSNEKVTCDKCGKAHAGKCQSIPCGHCVREKHPDWLAWKHTEDKCWHKNPELAPTGWVSRPPGVPAAPPDGVQVAISVAPSTQ